MLTDREEVIYLAGFFDGEGSIVVHKRLKPRVQHVVQVAVGQIDPRPLERFQRRYGGSIGLHTRSKQSDTKRDFHQWTIASKRAGAVLAELLPFLTVKRAQAILALAVQDRMRHQGGNKGLPDGELDIREDLRQRIAMLNHAPYVDGGAKDLWALMATSEHWTDLEREMQMVDTTPSTVVEFV